MKTHFAGEIWIALGSQLMERLFYLNHRQVPLLSRTKFFQRSLTSLPLRIDGTALRKKELTVDILEGVFPAEAFFEIVRLPLGQPSPIAWRPWRQSYTMDELVEELFYLAFLRLLAHHTDSRLVGCEYLGRVRPVFSQASVMPEVRLRTGLVKNIDWPRRRF